MHDDDDATVGGYNNNSRAGSFFPCRICGIRILVALLQLWMAMLVARWFCCCVSLVGRRLRVLELDVDGRHAAHVDDAHFSLAVGSIFAAAFAASPLQVSSGSSSSASLVFAAAPAGHLCAAAPSTVWAALVCVLDQASVTCGCCSGCAEAKQQQHQGV